MEHSVVHLEWSEKVIAGWQLGALEAFPLLEFWKVALEQQNVLDASRSLRDLA